MAGGIKKTEIVEADLNQLSNELKIVGDNIMRIIEISAKVKPITGLGELSKATKETSDNATELDRIGKKLALSEQRLKDLMDERTKAIIANNKATQEQTAEMKRQATIAKAVEGSYEQINAEMNSNINAYKRLSQAQRENEAIGGQMIKTIQAQDAQLKQLDATMGRNQRNVGNYKSGFNGLNFSIMQIGRELPSLAYGFNVFVGALSNNIPMMTDEIKKAQAQVAILKAEGQAFTPVWKQMLGAIISWQTAMVVGITVVTMYGREIAAWTKEVFKGRDAVNSLHEAMKAQNKTAQDLGAEMSKEKTAMKLNFLVANDVTRSYEERLSAANKLISKYPEILGNYTSEQLLTSKLSGTYEQLTRAIEKSFEARFAETKILDNYKEMAKQQKIIDEGGSMWGKFSRLTVKYTKDLDGARNKIEQIRGENRKLFEQFNVTGEDKFGIKEASKEFEIYSKLQSKETKRVFDERSGFVSKDAQTYRQWLTNQLVVYKDNVDAKMALEQELSAFIEKDKKDQAKSAKELAKEDERLKKESVKMALKFDDELMDSTDQSNKEALQLVKDTNKSIKESRKEMTDFVVGESMAQADEEKLSAQETAIEKIKAAKTNKDEIEKIQHELTLFMIDEDIKAQQRILDSAGLGADAYANASERIRRLRLQRGEEEIQFTQQTEEQKKQIRNETMQATNELLQQGLAFSQQIYSQQATRAQETYNAEMNAAGDSLEYQTLAKRKFEAEDKKIKQRQAIASKLQAVLDAGLALALAIATTWKNPLLAALNIGAATLGLGMALATPIPQFAEGVESSPSTFIAGEEGNELIRTKSGKMILTPNKATLFSDNNLIGSTVFPHDQTQRMLANMAFNQVREVVDMKDTNRHLSGIEKNTRNRESRFTDSKGRTVVKRGNLTSIL